MEEDEEIEWAAGFGPALESEDEGDDRSESESSSEAGDDAFDPRTALFEAFAKRKTPEEEEEDWKRDLRRCFAEGDGRILTVAVVSSPGAGRSFLIDKVRGHSPVPLDPRECVVASQAGLVRCAFFEVDAAEAPRKFALGGFRFCDCVVGLYDARCPDSLRACLEASAAVRAQQGLPACLVANFADAADRKDDAFRALPAARRPMPARRGASPARLVRLT